MTKYDLLVPRVQGIIDEYSGMRLTLRQIYYRLVAAQAIENTVSQYKGLSSLLVKARLQGDIAFDDIEDRTRAMQNGYGDDRSPEAHFRMFWDYIENMDENYTMPKWWGQSSYIQIWLEKEALSALFSQVTNVEGVDLAVCRGYPSLTFLYEAAQGLLALDGKEILILYFGDFDPSGADIERDVREYLRDEFGVKATFSRIAITRAQIEEYEIPPAPAKRTDSRYRTFVKEHGVAWQVELDAIEPRTLQGLVHDAITSHFDEASSQRRRDELTDRRGRIAEWLEDALNPDFEPPEGD